MSLVNARPPQRQDSAAFPMHVSQASLGRDRRVGSDIASQPQLKYVLEHATYDCNHALFLLSIILGHGQIGFYVFIVLYPALF